jgi:hypothetical protein
MLFCGRHPGSFAALRVSMHTGVAPLEHRTQLARPMHSLASLLAHPLLRSNTGDSIT